MPTDAPLPIAFIVVAALTLVSTAAAMSLRNLVHCGLCAAGSFAGLALMYLQLNAEFVGFAQILVYVGAVSILIVFAILLTRSSEIKSGVTKATASSVACVAVAALLFCAIAIPIVKSASVQRPPVATAQASVQKIGEQLMTRYVLPLEVIGLLLTAALIGAVIIAMREKGQGMQEVEQVHELKPALPTKPVEKVETTVSVP